MTEPRRGEEQPGRDAPEPPEVRAEAASELEGLRREIDGIDERIVELLNARARLGLAVGQAKLRAGWSGVRDPGREREVLERVTRANGGPLPRADLIAIYRRLIAATRTLEDEDRAPGPRTQHGGSPDR
jgi:chorismate mutase/prephenate dehydratase